MYLKIAITVMLNIVLNIAYSQSQVHLNKYNLALICECDIFSDRIFLSSKNISSIDPDTFTWHTEENKLEIINLSYNPIEFINATTFEPLKNLVTLDMFGTKLTKIDKTYFTELNR
jgi:hypothetical protein